MWKWLTVIVGILAAMIVGLKFGFGPGELDALVKWSIARLDPSFLAIGIILSGVGWFFWCMDREQTTHFKIVRFFMTNGHEDMAKLVMFLITIVLMWGFILLTKREDFDVWYLMAYMSYALGAPIFYSFLRTIMMVFGKPENVKMASDAEKVAPVVPVPAQPDQPEAR